MLEILGDPDDIRVVMRGLLAVHGRLHCDAATFGRATGTPEAPLLDALPDDLERELATLDPDEVCADPARHDLRDQPCLTIDPDDAKDHDDAIHAEPHEDGWRLSVHIADVTAYVSPDGQLDRWAQQRAMSAYMPGVVAPMLPEQLSADLCSLREGVDRPAVTVECSVSHGGEVTDVRVRRTLIRVARRLTYGEAAQLIDSPDSDEAGPLVQALHEMASTLTSARGKRGALMLDLPERSFDVRDGRVGGGSMRRQNQAHQLVEECMLAANLAVGGILARTNTPALWRVHEHPDPQAVAALVDTLAELDVPTLPVPETMSGREAARYAAQLAAHVASYSRSSGRGVAAFPSLILRSLQQAVYAAHPGPHSGLAVENYLHFTSPIRRYPDIVVHRAILDYIGCTADAALPSQRELADVAERVSHTERQLMRLERTADSIVAAILLEARMRGRLGEPPEYGRSWDGEIVGVISSGVFVRFAEMFEGFVPARTIGSGERYELDLHGTAVVGARSGHSIRLGDTVAVGVERIDTASGRVELRIVNGDR